MGRKKKIDLNKSQQVNGAVDNTPAIFNYLRQKELPYKARTLEEYRKELERMNLSDLQRHAIEVAHILPNITDRSRLVTKLENEFLHKLSNYNTKFNESANPTSGVSAEQAENIRKLLNR